MLSEVSASKMWSGELAIEDLTEEELSNLENNYRRMGLTEGGKYSLAEVLLEKKRRGAEARGIDTFSLIEFVCKQSQKAADNLVTYGEIWDHFFSGRPWAANHSIKVVGGALGGVIYHCVQQKLPILSVLVVEGTKRELSNRAIVNIYNECKDLGVDVGLVPEEFVRSQTLEAKKFISKFEWDSGTNKQGLSQNSNDSMNIWRDDIVSALTALNGVAHLSKIYEAVEKARARPLPKTYQAIIRRELEYNSSDAGAWKGVHDLFYSVEGIGKGVWGLRSMATLTPDAIDREEPPERAHCQTFRVLRDTALARQLKQLHGNACQMCGEKIQLGPDQAYSEAHHIRPLGAPHNGPDVAGNILVLCPNHHVACDYAAVELDVRQLRQVEGHIIEQRFIDYHNERYRHQ